MHAVATALRRSTANQRRRLALAVTIAAIAAGLILSLMAFLVIIVAVCYLDLDGFKQVNDSHGHDAGDALLVEISRRLQASLRSNDTAGRLGGDEFVIVLTLLSDEAEVQSILQRLVASLESPVTLMNGVAVRVGASVGVSLSPRDGSEPSTLLTKADQAMLRAKRAGKSRIEMA
jgi:diguanylate cyclase (GGDEF)-like protein